MPERRAMVFGTGLIGGSVGLALAARGWEVSGTDDDPDVAERALARGAVHAIAIDRQADLVVVATPVRATSGIVATLSTSEGWRPDVAVTDVGGVKGPLVGDITHPGFVGGHPMAGSEQVGLDGATAELFLGATWVLTPTERTDPSAYATVRSVVIELGASVVDLRPDQHDRLVAVVSHVPHLTAATLMDLAASFGEEHNALLQLAAGGFRDMTRVAAGQPGIWPDICDDNAEAIVTTLDLLIAALGAMRRRVAERDRRSLLEILSRAAEARRSLVERAPRPEQLVEVRVPVSDQLGTLADVTTMAAELGVNIYDLEIAHSVEGDRGVLVLVVDTLAAPTLVTTLVNRGYRATGAVIGASR
ncbi:MAG: prephenate dehydrogenase/arogenate dehydrogenase family protein [Acidimicrobiales bacterium]